MAVTTDAARMPVQLKAKVNMWNDHSGPHSSGSQFPFHAHQRSAARL
mgnify:CR=1 FL=1